MLVDIVTPSNHRLIIDYITIASEGNAIDFGDLTHCSYTHHGASSSTRGCFLVDGISGFKSQM